ncbi:type VI secretion system tip protein VgrG [Aquincola sp. MAHUQ-54]|uniref:Type VI secretion system tip protein VgrG n=1 Tax=Aquincola agrisoli TaxID=3119538 RepID=A0AAW9QEH8_9BURK
MLLSDRPAGAFAAPFRLDLEGLPPGTLAVVRHRIEARLDAPYTVRLWLQADPALLQALREPVGRRATFFLQSQAHSFEPFHGRVAEAAFGGWAPDDDAADPLSALLDAPALPHPNADALPLSLVLRPRLWWAGLGGRHRHFQRQSTEDTVRAVLAEHGLTAADVRFVQGTPLPARRYRQQSGESDLVFVHRLLQAEGLWYRFEQTPEREVMVVGDDAGGWARPPHWSAVRFVAPAGLATPPDAGLPGTGWQQVITDFERVARVVPTEARVTDRNYRLPALMLQAAAEGPQASGGTVHLHGLHLKTAEEAGLRARQAREHGRQGADRLHASSTLTALSPGQCFGVQPAPGVPEGLAGRWVVVAVVHEGDRVQPYRNRFEAQPEPVAWRPAHNGPPPLAGFQHLRVDTTDGANPYARLDAHGRYLAWRHAEHRQAPGGTGSAPLRLARDLAGADYGQHFPVHAGVEALGAHMHGDPDRPVLLGVAHDSRHPNPVTAANATRHVLRTWANNKLRLEDASGREHIKLATEHGVTQLHLGHVVNHARAERGRGFELRTDLCGALRSPGGQLLTTEPANPDADPQGRGHQADALAAKEHVQRILPWAERRSQAAQQVGLEAADLQMATQLLQGLPAGRLQAPLQVHHSPAGLAWAARGTLTFGSERTQGWHAQGPIALASTQPLGLTAKKGLRLHAEQGGIRHVTSRGDHTVHVQDGDFNVRAAQDVHLESKQGVVRLQSREGRYFVEVGPEGFRTNAREIRTRAGARIEFNGGAAGGAVAAEPATDAGVAGGLGYFGKMRVNDKQRMPVMDGLRSTLLDDRPAYVDPRGEDRACTVRSGYIDDIDSAMPIVVRWMKKKET